MITHIVAERSKPLDVFQEENLAIEYFADLDIDADGANGQNARQAAYMVGDKGSEFLANGGMGMQGGRVVGITSWYKDIVILGSDGRTPRVFSGGIIASKTAYKRPGFSEFDPAAYIDSEVVPYVVVPSELRTRAKGIILGCRATLRNETNGVEVQCGVLDIGPRFKIGEGSIAAARALRIPSSPRTGGTDQNIVRVTIHPGEAFSFQSETFELQRAA